MVPKQLFLTKGVGRHRDKLVSFELALRDAGIAQYNLVEVTSIVPPGCKMVSKEEGSRHLSPGEIVFCVMGRNSTSEPNRLVTASIGVAVPKEEGKYGYLLEHHSSDQGEEDAGSYAESLAAEMVATTYGNGSWDEYRNRRDGIAKTTNIAQTARNESGDLWTTVVVAAVFIPEED